MSKSEVSKSVWASYSPEQRAIRARLAGLGKKKAWARYTLERKQRIIAIATEANRRKAQQMSDEEKARCRKQLASNPSPYSVRDVNHPFSLYWSLRSPEGQTFRFKNMRDFVESHRHLFTEYQLRAAARNVPYVVYQLRRLSPRFKRPAMVSHGWTWHINKEPESICALLGS